MSGRKNKHGDRGSIEEEMNVTEWPNNEPNGDEEESDNMADSKEPVAASKKEPMPYEIRHTLVDLQKTVTSILKEKSYSERGPKAVKVVPLVKRKRSQHFKSIVGKGLKS